MTGPSIQKAAAFSLFVHLTILAITAAVLRHTRSIEMPSPYIVSIVGPEVSGRSPAGPEPSLEEETDSRAEAPPARDVKADSRRVDDAISMLEAKKRIERTSAIKKKMLTIRAQDDRKTEKPTPSAVYNKGAGPSSGAGRQSAYIDKVTSAIRREWAYPETGERDVEAVVSVRIMKDGTLNFIGFEKKSGVMLFDRLVIRTLQKASPVAPPPEEMEVGIRFYP